MRPYLSMLAALLLCGSPLAWAGDAPPSYYDDGYEEAYEPPEICENHTKDVCCVCCNIPYALCAKTTRYPGLWCGGSVLGMLSKEHRHDACDYATETRAPEASGCTSCAAGVGDGSGVSPATGALGSLTFKRFRRSHAYYGHGSFGRSGYSEYDDRISVFYEDSHRGIGVGCIRVYLADDTGDTHYFFETDTLYSNDTTVDGVYRDEHGLFRSLTLYDAQGAMTAVQANAVTAVLRDHKGFTRTFEIFIDGDGGRRGRLVSRADRNGVATTIAYEYAVGTLSGSDRSKYKRISTVTDPYGKQAQVTYHPTPYWVNWKIASVAFPNGTTVSYTYDSAHNLSGIAYPDGTTSTFTYGHDATRQQDYVIYDDAGAEGTHRRKTVYYSVLTYQRPDQTIVDTAPGLTRRVVAATGETIFAYWPSATAGKEYIYLGGHELVRQTRASGRILTQIAHATNYVHDEQALVPNLTGIVWHIETAFDFQSYRSLLRGRTDAFGRSESHPPDLATRLPAQETDRDGGVTTNTWNTFSQPLTTVDKLGRTTTRVYDTTGNLLSQTEGVGTAAERTRSWTYNSRGQPLTATDGNGHVTDYVYDTAGRLVQVIEPPDQVGGSRVTTTYAYDTAGRLASVTNPVNQTTQFSYDARNRLTTVTYADTSTEIFAFGTGTEKNLLKTRTDRNGRQTRFSYDAYGRRTETIAAFGTPLAVTETCTYLPGTTLEATCLRAGDQIVYTYDHRNRRIATQRQVGAASALTESWQYDVMGRVVQQTDAYGRRTFQVYDVNDHVVRMVRELLPGSLGSLPGLVTTPPGGFAGSGQPGVAYLSSARDAALMALTRITTPNPPYVIEESAADAMGQIVSRTDGRGVRTTFQYDAVGQLTSQTEDALGLPATTQFTYDDAGNRLTVTSPRGVVTAMAYTGRNLLASVTEAANIPGEATLTRLMTYTATGKLWREWDANNASKTENDPTRVSTTYGYGGCCDRLTSITDPAGNVTAFAYDFAGNRTLVTDPNTLATVTTYDARHRTATVTNAASETTTYTYDDNLTDGVGIDAVSSVIAILPSLGLGAGADGSAVAVTNPAQETSYELRDGLGRTIARIDPLGHATRVAYDTVITTGDGTGLVETAVTSATGHTTRSQADAAGRVRRSIDALGNVATSGFDAVGNQVTFRDANQVGWNASYNGRNWLLSRSDTRPTETNITDWGYDLDGNRVSETNALGKTEFYDYDHRNRRTRITDRVQGITRFAYDLVGNLTQISDADNEIRGGLAHLEGCTQYAYDPRNLLVAEAFPAGQTGRTLRAYGYDAGRRLTTRNVGTLSGAFSATAAFATTPEVTTYQYDNANRLTTRGYPADGKNDTFAYDPASRLTSAVSARYASTVARTYDAAGRLDDESLTLANVQRTGTTVGPATWTIGYTYDADNRVTGLSYPTGSTVTRTYTDRDELDTVSLNGQPVIDRTYDAGGRLTQSTLGNGLTETRTYVPGTYLTANIAIPTVTGFAYTYDATQRKLTEGDSIRSVTQTFGYDDAGRLTSWSEGANTQSWNLSLVGDWNSTTRNGVPEPRVHTKVHEATQVGPNILTYDAKGNLTKDEKQTALAWDPENRLTRALVTPDASTTGFGAVATYRYDALGRRVAKTVQNRTTYFVPAGAQTVVEIEQTAMPSQAQVDGAEADGTLANAALAPASGGILPTTSGLVTRVNFQPQTTLIPAGFLADTGKISAVRTNGLTYGWSSDATAQTVVRNGAVPLVEFDTHIQLAPGQSWTIALPNGSYPVVVVAGDPLSTQQTNNFTINGQTLTDPDPATNPGYSAGDFDGWARMVEVIDGTLTITSGPDALDPKLCFIEIGQVVEPGTLMPQAIVDALAALITRVTTETGANPPSTEPVTKEFVYGSYVDEVVAYRQTIGDVVGLYYPHYNHLYSVAALTSGNAGDLGAVVERYSYNAYGKQKINDASGNVIRAKSSVGWDRGFTGYIVDQESSLLHARARQYSPTLGRFVGRDKLGYTDGFNSYRAFFSPNFLDPSGMTVGQWLDPAYVKCMQDCLMSCDPEVCEKACLDAYNKRNSPLPQKPKPQQGPVIPPIPQPGQPPLGQPLPPDPVPGLGDRPVRLGQWLTLGPSPLPGIAGEIASVLPQDIVPDVLPQVSFPLFLDSPGGVEINAPFMNNPVITPPSTYTLTSWAGSALTSSLIAQSLGDRLDPMQASQVAEAINAQLWNNRENYHFGFGTLQGGGFAWLAHRW